MFSQSTESSFFRKPKKSVTGVVQWCGESARENEPLQFHRASQRDGKMSLKEFAKKKPCVKNVIPISKPPSYSIKQRSELVITESRPNVIFSYVEPKVLQVQSFQKKPLSFISQEDQILRRRVKPQEEIKKDRPFLSFAPPSSLNIQLTSQKSQKTLSETKPTQSTKPNDEGRSQTVAQLEMEHSLITTDENSQLTPSPQQILKEEEKIQKNVQEKIELCSEQDDEKEAKDIVEAEEIVPTRKDHQGTMFGLKSACDSFRDGWNILERNKYEKGKLFSKIRKIQTMLSEDDGQTEEWSKVSQVLENYQGLLSKFARNKKSQEIALDSILPN